jgi:predicted alpha/beta hydrolase family esterase
MARNSSQPRGGPAHPRSDQQTAGVPAPVILTLADLDGASPGHWLRRWEEMDDNVRAVDMVDWQVPNRNLWVNRLNLAVHHAVGEGRKVILVGHGVGCLTVAWWAHYETPDWGDPVIGALLVSPPDVDGVTADAREGVFSPTPLGPLPFPSILVAGRDDPHADFPRASRIASFWGSDLVDAASLDSDPGAGFGHGDDDAIGDWTAGRRLLGAIARRARRARPTPPAARPLAPEQYAI